MLVLNESGRDEDVSVTVYREDEPVYDETHALDAHDRGDPDGVYFDEPWLGDQVFYEVVTDSPNVEEAAFTTADVEEIAGDFA